MALTFLLPIVLLIGGWHARNYFVAGVTEFSTVAPKILYFYREGGIIQHQEDISLEKAKAVLEARLEARSFKTEQAKYDFMRSEATDSIRKNLNFFMEDQFRGAFQSMTGDGFISLKTSFNVKNAWFNRGLKVFARGFYDLLIFGIVCSIIFLMKGGNVPAPLRANGFIILLIFYLLMASAGQGAYSRFRVPIMPLVSLYASIGLMGAIGKCRSLGFRSWRGKP
jgi:hypothetical protein